MIDRPLGDHQPLGDLRVAQPQGQQLDHVQLACGQTCTVLLRICDGAARHAPLTQQRNGAGRTTVLLGCAALPLCPEDHHQLMTGRMGCVGRGQAKQRRDVSIDLRQAEASSRMAPVVG